MLISRTVAALSLLLALGPSTAALGPSTAALGPSTAALGPSTAALGPSTAATETCTMYLVLVSGIPQFSDCIGSCDTPSVECKLKGRISHGAIIKECRCGSSPSTAECAASLSSDNGAVTVNCEPNGCFTPQVCVNNVLSATPQPGCECN
jgi:hypothetical protein